MMTIEERDTLLRLSIDKYQELAHSMNQDHNFERSYGIYRRNKDSIKRICQHLAENPPLDRNHEPDWEWPKGMPIKYEHGLVCAIREFKEEIEYLLHT